ncbi:hypothetical protein THAOC_30639, partial [Thalassiosira oceanica]
SGGL